MESRLECGVFSDDAAGGGEAVAELVWAGGDGIWGVFGFGFIARGGNHVAGGGGFWFADLVFCWPWAVGLGGGLVREKIWEGGGVAVSGFAFGFFVSSSFSGGGDRALFRNF